MTSLLLPIRDFVLNEWEAGETMFNIAARTPLTPTEVSGIVKYARKKGDPRAVIHGPGPKLRLGIIGKPGELR
jgi:hypothetical protein